MQKGLHLPTGFLGTAITASDFRTPLCNISGTKLSFTSLAMSLVQKDRGGPQILGEVSNSARHRWRALQYRPATLKRVSPDLIRLSETGRGEEPDHPVEDAA